MVSLLQQRLHNGYVRCMDVPADFRVAPLTASNGLPGKWMSMQGGPLPCEVWVRVEAADGRFMVTGLVVGPRWRREITWETLRQIRPATLLAYLFAGFDPNNPRQQYEATDPAPPVTLSGEDFDLAAWERDDEDLPKVSSHEWHEHMRATATYRLWQDAVVAGRDDVYAVEVVTKPRARVATDLTHFAEVYLRHLATSPHKATKATSDELFISRATVIRRVAECRRLGLIPKGSTS